MAHRKGQDKKKGVSKGSMGCLFWIAFIILIFGLFLLNQKTIRETLEKTQFMNRVLTKPEDTELMADPTPSEVLSDGENPNGEIPTEDLPSLPSEKPVVSVQEESETVKPRAEPTSEKPVTVSSPATLATPKEKPIAAPELRDRTLYFMQLDDDGIIVRVTVPRAIPVSDAPLTDVLQALLSGPTEKEQELGYLNLIPPGTRLLSASVRGETAYLNFSEEFQFNTYGIEGYAAQLRQVIWTTSEFSTVKDVQILIEGRRLDYLGAEGIWIGSPLNRESL